MAKKKEVVKEKTFKPMPEQGYTSDWPTDRDEAPAVLEVTVKDKQALIDRLLKVEGMNQELAEHMAAHGIPGDSYVVQTFYRVSAVTADAVIKIFKESMK